MKRFEAAFGGEVHRLDYQRSPLLKKMLGIARCKVHFLEGPKDRLKVIREHVTLRYTSPRKARIVTTKYVLAYDDGSTMELSESRAAKLTEAECRGLLNPKRTHADGSRKPAEELWSFAAPSFAAAMLLGIAIRRRRYDD